MPDQKPISSHDWKDRSASAGPALLGCAAGVLLGEALHNGAKKPVVLSLALLGVAALAPNAVAGVLNRVAGPDTRRGHARRLNTIRDGGFAASDLGVDESEVDYETLGV